MPEVSEISRSELLEEYHKLVDIVQRYDEYYIRIKGWGVTVSGAAAGFGSVEESSIVFLITAVLAFSFWLTEVRYKQFQLRHLQRVWEIENPTESGLSQLLAPRIFTAYGEERRKNVANKRWYTVMFWPQVMLPHVFFVIIGLAGAGYLFALMMLS